jgi:glycosyltransferase involved in cell wall biosynthesis
MKTVSIVTPSYNQGQFLAETIESVLSQDGDFYIDYIIADGGSTDDSVAVIEKYERLLNSGDFPVKCRGIDLRWWSHKDAGQSAALNEGFKMATGEIIGWLNSDDCYRPGAVRRAVDALLADPNIDLVYGYCDKTDEAGRTLEVLKSPEFDRRLIFSNPNVIYQPTVFWRRSLLEKVGLLDEDLQFAMDFDLWLRMAKVGEFKLIPEVLATYRFTTDSKSVARDKEFWPEVDRILRRNGLRLSPIYLALHRLGWAHRLWAAIRTPWLIRAKNRLMGFWQAPE